MYFESNNFSESFRFGYQFLFISTKYCIFDAGPIYHRNIDKCNIDDFYFNDG